MATVKRQDRPPQHEHSSKETINAYNLVTNFNNLQSKRVADLTMHLIPQGPMSSSTEHTISQILWSYETPAIYQQPHKFFKQ
jgi:diadenosine tetraphosphate (Ap4A) HIT family hydrolase